MDVNLTFSSMVLPQGISMFNNEAKLIKPSIGLLCTYEIYSDIAYLRTQTVQPRIHL